MRGQGIVMLDWKTLNSMPNVKFCKGTIVAARVYADVKGGKCPCGGAFSKRVPHPRESFLILPVCASCNEPPSFYAIDIDAKDENGDTLHFRIRHTKDAERLDSDSSVVYILKVIQREILDGSFNVHHYASAKSKDSLIFKNYVLKYLAHQERRLLRKEISPKGLHDKKGLINRELLPFFGRMEIFRINENVIREFKDLYVDKLRTRDLALGELKALLNQAERDGMGKAPKFDPIPRSKKRDDTITKELALKTIEAMPKQIYRDFYTLLLIYPIRPGELRALKWSEVNLAKGEFTVCWHFSNEIRTEGRKSIKKDKKEGSITFPISPEAREIFLRQRSAAIVSLNEYVFLSRFGRFLSEATVWEAWNLARKRLDPPHEFAPYECRHASASELYKKLNGDLIRMKEVIGMTNTATLERYVTDRSDNRGLF
jgi:integrase